MSFSAFWFRSCFFPVVSLRVLGFVSLLCQPCVFCAFLHFVFILLFFVLFKTHKNNNILLGFWCRFDFLFFLTHRAVFFLFCQAYGFLCFDIFICKRKKHYLFLNFGFDPVFFFASIVGYLCWALFFCSVSLAFLCVFAFCVYLFLFSLETGKKIYILLRILASIKFVSNCMFTCGGLCFFCFGVCVFFVLRLFV